MAVGEESLRNLQSIIDKVVEIDRVTGGFESKVEVRETGFSLHVRYARKQVGVATALEDVQVFQQAPGLLVDACRKLLAFYDDRG